MTSISVTSILISGSIQFNTELILFKIKCSIDSNSDINTGLIDFKEIFSKTIMKIINVISIFNKMN